MKKRWQLVVKNLADEVIYARQYWTWLGAHHQGMTITTFPLNRYTVSRIKRKADGVVS